MDRYSTPGHAGGSGIVSWGPRSADKAVNSSEQEQKQVFSYLSKQSEHRGGSFLRHMIVMVLGNTFSSGNLVRRAAVQKRLMNWQ